MISAMLSEVSLAFSDDGAGLQLGRIRDRAAPPMNTLPSSA